MSGERFEFNKVTFALPIQAFKVGAFISTEERLPVVTEFVLRLLHTCGRVSLSGFRDYFGFSEAEALSVIESLDRQGYVKLVDDALSLSEEIIARFDASPDDCPWVTKLKKRTDTVPFDLLAFTSLRRTEFAFASDNWVKLNPSADIVGSSVERARRAYRENFAQIERESARARGDERERSYGVHSIESVEAKKPSFIPVTVSLGLELGNKFSSQLPEDFEAGASPDLLAQFRERVANEFEREPAARASSVDEFIDLFHLDFLRKYVEGSRFDVGRFAADVVSGMIAPAGVQPLFGGLCLRGNREAVSSLIYDARQGHKGAPKHLCSMAWLAPDYPFWGRGEDFKATVEMWSKALKAGGGGDDLFIIDYAQERQEPGVRAKFSNTGLTELHLVRPEGVSAIPWLGELELMLYPGQFAVALLHTELEGYPGVRVGFGVLSTLTKHLHLVHRLMENVGSGARYAGRWSPKKLMAPSKQRRSFHDGCPVLAYSDYSPEHQK